MATDHPVKMCVTLDPVGNPWIDIDVCGQRQVQQLTTTTKFDFEFIPESSPCCLKVKHFKKDDNDSSTAVVVKEISFFGISDPKFVWAGVYYPDYPLHYLDKVSSLNGQDYLGWNGVYQLEFSVPVFTWMHTTLDLGWIY